MFGKYRYFIVLAEECNISKAADRLFVTHQNLSKYLANLEESYGVTLFQRKPKLVLTHAGQLMLKALKETERIEKNLRAQYIDLNQGSRGVIRLGTTEGRFRILMPNIMSEFKSAYPNVDLLISSTNSLRLREMVQNGQLDLMVAAIPPESHSMLEYTVVLNEKLYLVISDNMLRQLFGDRYPACKDELRQGADMRLFKDIPFAVNLPHANSHILLEKLFFDLGISMNYVHMSSHPDLHHMMSSRDFAASFCLTMYIPSLLKINEGTDNKLNIFPIMGLNETNPVAIYHARNQLLPHYTRALIHMLTQQCGSYTQYDDMGAI